MVETSSNIKIACGEGEEMATIEISKDVAFKSEYIKGIVEQNETEEEGEGESIPIASIKPATF